MRRDEMTSGTNASMAVVGVLILLTAALLVAATISILVRMG
jgi:hypothetical protein